MRTDRHLTQTEYTSIQFNQSAWIQDQSLAEDLDYIPANLGLKKGDKLLHTHTHRAYTQTYNLQGEKGDYIQN